MSGPYRTPPPGNLKSSRRDIALAYREALTERLLEIIYENIPQINSRITELAGTGHLNGLAKIPIKNQDFYLIGKDPTVLRTITWFIESKIEDIWVMRISIHSTQINIKWQTKKERL